MNLVKSLLSISQKLANFWLKFLLKKNLEFHLILFFKRGDHYFSPNFGSPDLTCCGSLMRVAAVCSVREVFVTVSRGCETMSATVTWPQTVSWYTPILRRVSSQNYQRLAAGNPATASNETNDHPACFFLSDFTPLREAARRLSCLKAANFWEAASPNTSYNPSLLTQWEV